MAKTRDLEGVTLTYPATTAYKQWVWREIRKRWPKGAQQAFVDELKHRARKELAAIGKFETISTATISDFLGREGATPTPSNSALLPAFNKVLGLAPPPVCDPTDTMTQLVERFRRRWERATPRERAILLAAIGDDDEPGDVDRDSAGPSEASSRARRG